MNMLANIIYRINLVVLRPTLKNTPSRPLCAKPKVTNHKAAI